MGINELMRIVSEAYPDGIIAAEYWDFKRECPRRNAKGGDTLALFIASEIADTYDPDTTDEQQINAVLKALSTARSDLAAVSAALAGELEKRQGKER